MNARINPDDLREVFLRWDRGESQERISAHFGVTREAISQIIRGVTWKEQTVLLRAGMIRRAGRRSLHRFANLVASESEDSCG